MRLYWMMKLQRILKMVQHHMQISLYLRILFHILDRKELDFKFNTRTRFKDMESASQLTTEPWQIKSSYKKRIQRLQNDYKKQCREQLIDYVPLFTDQSLDIALNSYLNKRQKLG